MVKITVLKKVYWKAADKEMSGKVTKVMLDHVFVKTDDGEYLVRKAVLSLQKPSK